MAVNLHILKEAIKDERLFFAGPETHDLNLETLLLLKQSEQSESGLSGTFSQKISESSEVLYVMTAENYESMRQLMERRHMSCAILRSDLEEKDLPGILNQLLQVFHEYARWEKETQECARHCVFPGKTNFRKILIRACEKLANPIALFDASSVLVTWACPRPDSSETWQEKLYSLSDRMADQPPYDMLPEKVQELMKQMPGQLSPDSIPGELKGSIWQEVLQTGRYHMESLQPAKQREIYRTMEQTGGILLERNMEPGSKGEMLLSLPLRYDHIPIGSLGMADIFHPITDGQISIVYYLKKMLEEAYQAANLPYGGTSIPIAELVALLEGENVDERILSYHLKRMNWNIEGEFIMLGIGLDKDFFLNPFARNNTRYRLTHIFPQGLLIEYDSALLVITPVSDEDGLPGYGRVESLCSEYDLHGAVSEPFYSLRNLSLPWNQIRYTLSLHPAKRLSQYDDYYEQILFSCLQGKLPGPPSAGDGSAQVMALIDSGLYHACETAALSGQQLSSLEAWLVNGRNTLAASRSLHMHRNTLSYQIEKIGQILGKDLTVLGDRDLFRLLMSCKLLHVTTLSRHGSLFHHLR